MEVLFEFQDNILRELEKAMTTLKRLKLTTVDDAK